MARISLSQNKFALIDDADKESIFKYKWHVNKGRHTFYARTNIPCKMGNRRQTSIQMHRFILKVSDGEYVDHINGNGLDCRRSNMRICSLTENSLNRKTHSNNSSGFKGVTLASDHWRSKPWRCQIRVNRKLIEVGQFKTKLEAAKAYNMAASKYFGEFARLNPI